ncbi:hypothetical protein C8R47DRAFT_960244 [Mycena vitilis]|nr:hypothetical protein C8R47DRAFT_960244 [Mycena vitilis]
MYFSRSKYEIKSEVEPKAAREAAYAGYKRAMSRTFAEIFGVDVNNLGNWQSLCRVLEIDPVPHNLYACRAAVREIHVNLVDLVDWGGTGAPITKFDSLEELAQYTHVTRKFFPQDRAEEGGLLKYLLRHIARKGNPDHLQIFFADYPLFHYNSSEPISAQYRALCRLYRLYRGEPDSDKAYAGFQRAMSQTFSDIFGSNIDDLGNLQSLCRLLCVDPIPENIYECRKAVRGVHVNLVDLVDWGRMGAAIHKFETEQDLAEYTKRTEKYFPQGEAEGSLLKFLLRRII